MGRGHHLYRPNFLLPTKTWSIQDILQAVLLNCSATSKQGDELLLVVCDIPLHDVHAGTQQPLEGFNIHDCQKREAFRKRI